MVFIITLLFSVQLKANLYSKKVHTIEHEHQFSYSERWTNIARSERLALSEILKFLKTSKTGNILLESAERKAKLQGDGLFDVILAGEGSLTDTTLLRKFSPDNPEKISYESKSRVFLNRRLSFMNAVLDLAHELTHFTLRKAFNPYKDNFSIQKFVSSTVEGKGGEVDAYMIECKVFFELFSKNAQGRTNCNRVLDPETGKLSKTLGIQEFYKIGNHYSQFKEKLNHYHVPNNHFENLSKTDAQFISSAYGVPYPVAAIEEYENIMHRVCANDKKRLAIIKKNYRNLASDNSSLEVLTKSFNSRCSLF